MQFFRKLKLKKANLKIAKKILKGTIIMCPYCKSLEITHQEPQTNISRNSTRKKYYIECKKCKSNGMITEHWIKD